MKSPNSRRRAWLAWAAIVITISFVLFKNFHQEEAPISEALLDDVKFKVRAFFAVELQSLESQSAGTVPTLVERQDSLIRDLENETRTAKDRLRKAIIVGELSGGEEALAELSVADEALEDVASLRAIYENGVTSLDSSQRDGLVRRHGFLGQVALAYGIPADMEPRKSVMRSTHRFILLSGGVVLGFFLLAAFSIVSFITAVSFFRKGKIRRAYVSAPSAKAVFLGAFAAYLILFIFVIGAIQWLLGGTGLKWNWLALLIIPFLMFWTARSGTSLEERRKAFGWHKGTGWFREAGAGIVGYAAGLVIVAAGFATTYMITRYTGTQPTHPVVEMLGGSAWQVIGIYGVACIMAPILEETMFRGLLFHHLRGRWGWIVSASVVSLIFAIVHPQGWAAVPVLSSLAIVLAALREWRGSIIAPMVAHACNNFLVLTLALILFRG